MSNGEVVLRLDVDDAAMKADMTRLSHEGMRAASERAVLKSAQLARQVLRAATRAAMHDNPETPRSPYRAGNFKRPRIKRDATGISAGTGYTSAGFFVRFRSTGTNPRYRGSGILHPSRRGGALIRTRDQGGGYTGVELGLGMSQIAAHAIDPQFPHIADLEMQAEIAKDGLA